MITYELAERLEKAGFKSNGWWGNDNGKKFLFCPPSLSELIEACGENFGSLERCGDSRDWMASEAWGNGLECAKYYIHGETPEEAVANLWLFLNQKQ